MKRTGFLITVIVAVCLGLVAGCTAPDDRTEDMSKSAEESNSVEFVNATFKAFSMDVPAEWVVQYSEAELKNNTIQLKSDDSTTPDAFVTISHFEVPDSSISIRDVTTMMSSTGNDMDPIDVDGAEGGINYSYVNDYHHVEVLFYTPDDTTQVRITLSYKDSSKDMWDKYADEFYKSIRFN